MAKSRLRKLADAGQSIWVDNLSRELVHGGGLQRLVDEDAVTGVTSNPTIFQKAIAAGRAYDQQLAAEMRETDDPRDLFFRLAVADVQDACDVLRPTWEKTGGDDGFVSLEVDPGLAYDTTETFEQAIDLHGRVDRPNVYIKIPATRLGLPAIEDCIARGRSINITLIFSLERYRAVVEAYLRGLERLVAGGGDPSGVRSVASFFVSRLDTEADRRLEELGADPKLAGRLGIANARLAYEHFLEAFSGQRWEFLAGKGARVQRPLWASTSTKNPAYPDTMYVEELVGPDTVNTMPPETIAAFRDHGKVLPGTVAKGFGKARKLIAALAEAGVDYDDLVETLEAEGVQKFADSFDELLAGIREKQGALAAA
jgi:transaldolase